MELPQLPQLVRVRAVAVGARSLENCREILDPRIGEKRRDAIPEEALPEVRMAIPIRAERRRCVVHVERTQSLDSDPRLDLVEKAGDGRRVGHVDTGNPEVTAVEAESETRVAVEPVTDRDELVDRPADRSARARGVLEKKPGRVRGVIEGPPQRRHDAIESDVETGSQMRADVEHHVALDLSGDAKRIHERRLGLLVEIVSGRGEVDQVEGVTEDVLDSGLDTALAEPLEVRRIVVRRAPHPRALREDLHRVPADRLDAVDRRVDPAGARHVAAVQHVASIRAVSTGPVRVRMAPSPTGFLHIGGVRTFLFNWLFARGSGGSCLLRIENTDTSREVAESVAQIERSLTWLGIDWDGPTTFQLDRMDRASAEARRLVAEGTAYEEEGAIRIRMPDEGSTGWQDAVKGWIEFPNEKLEDVVLVRSDGRPTYNFASPLEDWLDGITHVIRGDDHVSNTPKQIQVLRALGAVAPVYAHVPNVFGTDGKKLSKRHGAVSVDEFRAAGYRRAGAHELPRAARLEL